jgi:hypothetical protein
MGKKTKFICTAGLITGALYLSKEDNRKKVKEGVNKLLGKPNSWTDDEYVIHLGKPDQERDSDMVEEGALTSVQYYNELREEAEES